MKLEQFSLRIWCQEGVCISSTDNIDMLDVSHNGKNTFHASQIAAWQRDPSCKTNNPETLKSSTKTLSAPNTLAKSIPPVKPVRIPEAECDKNCSAHLVYR